MRKALLILLVLSSSLSAQDAIQLIRGRISEQSSAAPVQGATILLSGPSSYTFHSDSLGRYEGPVKLGTYTLVVYCPLYKPIMIKNVVLVSGKQQVQDIELEDYNIQLDSVAVLGMPSGNSVTLDPWNIQRFAAAFYDPARMLTSYSGNINTDDQANHISVHGTSPGFIQWKVEGVEVVNPNHLENAGTINDRPAPNGGGVSLFSAQLLQTSGFQLAPFESVAGNCLSGLFDMRMRSGNNEKYEHAIQAGLLGTDLSIEGPFSKRKRASFLFNYRFSTVGVLSLLGVDFGGEKINYQDISFTLNFPYRRGKAKVFAMVGNSENIFRGPKDSTELEVQKDLLNIDYRSFTAISGVNFLTSLSNTLLWRSVIAWSGKQIYRRSEPGFFSPALPVESDRFEQQKISTLHYLSKRISPWLRLKAGSHINYFTSEVRSSYNELVLTGGKLDELMLEPFVSAEGDVGKVDFMAGLHGTWQQRINDFVLQPRLRLGWRVSEQHYLMARYGMSSQLQPAALYLGHDGNRDLRQSLVNAYALEYHMILGKVTLKNEFFWQDYDRLPEHELSGFSAFNYFNEVVPYELSSTGKANVYGYDLTAETNYKGLYLVASGSIFSSRYRMQGTWYDGRFNSHYNAAFTAGKEFTLKDKNRMISTDARLFFREGFREQDIYFYRNSLANYHRVDFRVSYRRNKTKSAVIWALDIQNLTNRKNEAYHYYDRFTHKEEVRYQLGIIPVLSYKVLF